MDSDDLGETLEICRKIEGRTFRWTGERTKVVKGVAGRKGDDCTHLVLSQKNW